MDLPDEVFLLIMTNLNIKDLLSCRLINRRFSTLSIHDNIWESLVKTKFPYNTIKFSAFQTYCHCTIPIYIGVYRMKYGGAVISNNLGEVATRTTYDMEIHIVGKIIKDNNLKVNIEDIIEDDCDYINPEFDDQNSDLGIITKLYCEYQNNLLKDKFTDNIICLNDNEDHIIKIP
jgi:hypothetical protein